MSTYNQRRMAGHIPTRSMAVPELGALAAKPEPRYCRDCRRDIDPNEQDAWIVLCRKHASVDALIAALDGLRVPIPWDFSLLPPQCRWCCAEHSRAVPDADPATAEGHDEDCAWAIATIALAQARGEA